MENKKGVIEVSKLFFRNYNLLTSITPERIDLIQSLKSHLDSSQVKILFQHQLYIGSQQIGKSDWLILISIPHFKRQKHLSRTIGIEVFFSACKTRRSYRFLTLTFMPYLGCKVTSGLVSIS